MFARPYKTPTPTQQFITVGEAIKNGTVEVLRGFYRAAREDCFDMGDTPEEFRAKVSGTTPHEWVQSARNRAVELSFSFDREVAEANPRLPGETTFEWGRRIVDLKIAIKAQRRAARKGA